MDYRAFYETDNRFHRYVDADMKSSGRTLEETLAVKVVQNVADMYAVTPDKELIAESNMKSGGC